MNDLLSSAWEKFAASLSAGETLELESSYETFVSQALDDAISVTVDAPS